jgi:predicted DNA-binding transcriptional regulator YafY
VHFYLALIALAQRQPEDMVLHILQVKLLADDMTYRMALRWGAKLVEQWPQDLREKLRLESYQVSEAFDEAAKKIVSVARSASRGAGTG